MLLGVLAMIGGGVAWYRGMVRKEYASERDFGHLKGKVESLSHAIAQSMDEDDRHYEALRDRLDVQSGMLSEIRVILLTKLDGSTLGDRSQ